MKTEIKHKVSLISEGGYSRNILLLIISMMISGMVFFSGCEYEHKELIDIEGSDLRVIIDWQKAPTANPGSMLVFFYPESGAGDQGAKNSYMFEFENVTGGMVSVAPGDYRVVCVNNNSDLLGMRGTDFLRTFEIFTNTTSPTSMLSGAVRPPTRAEAEDPTTFAPDKLWFAVSKKITVKQGIGVDQEIVLQPEWELSSYTVEIQDIENLDAVTQISGTLSGLSESVFFEDHGLSSKRVRHPFKMKRTGKVSIRGHFFSFGIARDSQYTTRELVVYFILSDGTKHYVTIDVSDQVNNARDKRNIYILVEEGLKLPSPIGQGGGLVPEVTDWQEEHINLEM